MGDLTDGQRTEVVRITGGDELHQADVILMDGIKRLRTDAIVTVQELLGQFVYADTFFDINTIGSNDDTITVSIPDDSVTVVTTKTASETDVIILADKVRDALNNNVNFALSFKAVRMKSNPRIYITAKNPGKIGERPDSGDFAVSATGGITYTLGFDNIIRRKKDLALFPHPLDFGLGTINITGEVTTIAGAVSDQFYKYALHTTYGNNLLQNGSLVTPVNFYIYPDTGGQTDMFVDELRFFGGGNGIKFAQFLAKNVKLTNGILIEIKSDNTVKQLPIIYSTEDFKNVFAFGSAANFSINVQAGAYQFLAVNLFGTPFSLRKDGTFGAGNNDYIKISIRDDLRTVAAELKFLANGFSQES